MNFWLPSGSMLTKTKNIHEKHFFFKNEENIWAYGPREATIKNMKEIHAIGSEIIDATDGRLVQSPDPDPRYFRHGSMKRRHVMGICKAQNVTYGSRNVVFSLIRKRFTCLVRIKYFRSPEVALKGVMYP